MNCSLEERQKVKEIFLLIETGVFEAGFLEAPPTPTLTSHLVTCPHLATREMGKCEFVWIHSFPEYNQCFVIVPERENRY